MLFQNSNPIYNNEKVITQVFTAAPSFQNDESLPKYDNGFPRPPAPPKYTTQNEICKKLMTAQYASIAKFAVLKTLTNIEDGPVNLHLTLVGQGAYNNAYDTLNESFKEVIDIVKDRNVRVFIHIYDPPDMIKKGKKPLLYNIHKIFITQEVINKVYTNGKSIEPGSNDDPLEGYYCSNEDFLAGNITPKPSIKSSSSVKESPSMFSSVSSLLGFGNSTGGNNNNYTNSKKKYTYKYMANKRHRKRRSRKQRGGVFGASQWAPSLIGNNISAQETHLQGGILSADDTIMTEARTFQGGSKGGNISNVLAQGAVPASLFAANYMYSPKKRGHKRKSHKKNSRKHKKTHRKFRLY